MISVNNEVITPTIFPDGTSQVWKLSDAIIKYIHEFESIYITWEFESEAELMHICQLCHLIRYIDEVEINLNCPYLPYARQDKKVTNETTFSLRTFSIILERFVDKIVVFDAHSDVLYNICDNMQSLMSFESVDPKDVIEDVFSHSFSDVLCAPDNGAANRYDFNFGIVMKKVRNQTTGEITGIEIDQDLSNASDLTGLSVLMVDDLCDGGRTFIEAAKVLYKHGAKSVNLYVSHGIFSKGVQVLHDAGIRLVYTRKGLVSCEDS